MTTNKNKITNFIEDQLPGFVLDEAPKLKEFIQKYYEWLESSKVELDTVIPYFSKNVTSVTMTLTDAEKPFQGGTFGSFLDAEIVTGSTSNATGVVVKKISGVYYFVDVLGTFQNTETVTGSTSGHTGVITDVITYATNIKGLTTTTTGKILSDYTNLDGFRSFFVDETTTDPTKESARGFKVGETVQFLEEPYTGYSPKITKYTPQLISSIENILTLNDIDRTLDDFVDYFMIELLEAFPRDIAPDVKRIMVKKSKEFYQTKGTEDSFRYLFRTVFSNEELEFYYPKDDILRTSDGRWSKVKKMYIKPLIGGITDVDSRFILGSITGATAAVEKITQVRIGDLDIYETILNNDSILGEFNINEELYYLDGTTKIPIGNAYGLMKSLDIISSEQGFSEETSFYVNKSGEVVEKGDEPAAEQPFLSRLHICTGDLNTGEITDITIDDGGADYAVYDEIVFDNTDSNTALIQFSSAKAQVLEIDGGGAITKIRILYPGVGYIKLPTLTVSTVSGTGAVLTPIGQNVGSIKNINIKDPGINFTLGDTLLDLNDSGTYNVTAKFGTIYDDGGSFTNNSGFLSDKKYLIDSLYYQEYSYVLKIGLATNSYKNIVKRLVHPAGFQMFGEISTQTNLDLKQRRNIRTSILKIITNLNLKTKNSYERWLKIISNVIVKMKPDSIHGGFLPKLVFPTSVEKSLRIVDAKLQNVTSQDNLVFVLVNAISNFGDIAIEDWPWLDYETYKIKYRNLVVDATEEHIFYQKHRTVLSGDISLVVDATEEHIKQTVLSGDISGSQGDLFVTGSGTTFTTDFQDGDYIIFDGKKMIIESVVDDDTMEMTTSLCEDVNSEIYLKEENLL